MSRVDERLMAPGSFTIDLDRGSPEWVKALSENGFMRVIVTGCRVDEEALTRADLISVARYRGLYRKRSDDRCRWEGAGLPILLGDEDGKANTYVGASNPAARPLYDGSNTSWIRNSVLRNGTGGANGVTVGTITSAAAPTKAGVIEPGDSPRDVLDHVMDKFTTSRANPYEWRINHDGTLDVDVRNTLFPTCVTPTALCSRRTDVFGVVGSTDVIPVTRFDPGDDWEDWTSTVSVVGPWQDAYGYYAAYSIGGQADITSNPFVDLAGDPLVMRRVVQNNKVASNADADNVAERVLGRFDDVSRRLAISTDAYDVGLLCSPGDSVWVWDPDASLVDLAQQVDLGQPVFPLVVRVQGINWPVRDGMGVYAEYWTGSTWQVKDVSDFVLFDEGDARLTVGEPRRALVRFRPRWLAA